MLPRTRAWTVALVATAAMAISYVDRQTLAVLAPTVTKALGIDDAQYGWLGSAFALAYLAAGPLAGALIDRVGARRGLPGAIVLWSVVAAAHAIAPSFGVLLALRAALGIAESPSFPAAAQVVQRALPPADRARGLSTMFVGMSLGAMIAPPIAIGIATRSGSWRLAFVGTAVIAALWLPLWIAIANKGDARAALDARPPSATKARRDGTSAREARAAWSRLEVAVHPAMRRGLVGLFAVVPASAFMLAWEAKFYAREAHLGQAQLTPYLMASAFLYDAGALLFGDLASRRAKARGDDAPHRLLFAIGAALAASGMALLGFAHDARFALAGFALGAVGRGAIVTLANSDTLARMPQRTVAAAGGVIASAQSLGAIVLNPIIGHVAKASGYGGITIAIAGWTVPLAIAWIVWRPSEAAR